MDVCEFGLANQYRLAAVYTIAGPQLLDECRTLNGCNTGNSKITRGYDLPAQHIIHTVGPKYSLFKAEEKATQLRSCYKTSLQIAVNNSLSQIAFPSICTGAYNYPIEDATHIALDTVRRFLDSDEGESLEHVVFVVWSDTDKGVYEELIPLYFPASRSSARNTKPGRRLRQAIGLSSCGLGHLCMTQ